MRLLLDSHALVWFLENDPALSITARDAIETPDTAPLVSYASGWEMAIKVANGKLKLPIPFEDLFPAKLESLGFELLPIDAAHLHRLLQLPPLHKDPFDRLLIAQALVEELTLVSRDPHFRAYDVRVLW